MFSFLNSCGIAHTLQTAGDRVEKPDEFKYQTKEENEDWAKSIVHGGGLVPGVHDIYGKSL